MLSEDQIRCLPCRIAVVSLCMAKGVPFGFEQLMTRPLFSIASSAAYRCVRSSGLMPVCVSPGNIEPCLARAFLFMHYLASRWETEQLQGAHHLPFASLSSRG